MSRNRDRAGVHNQNVDTAPPNVMQNNNLEEFSFVIPTEFVELPSQGRFYPEGHPLRGQSSIEIKQMTAKEEDILTSKTLLKKGIALDRALQSVVLNKQINVNHMLVGDRNALIIGMRISGYSNLYETQVSCPSCGESNNYPFDLNKVNIYYGDKIGKLKITDNEDGSFEVQLPQTKANVVFRLLTGYDENALLNLGGRSKRKKDGEERVITGQLRNIIVSVNGSTSKEVLNYLIENIPSRDSRHLRMAYKAAAPTVDLTQDFECQECDFAQEMEVPLTADFFWPDR